MEDVTTEDDDTDMPDLRSGSDSSSGEDQAPVHPLHGPRRQSMRLRQPPAPEAVITDADVTVDLPPLSLSPSPEPDISIDNDRLQAILDELELDLAAAAAEHIKVQAQGRTRQPSVPRQTPPQPSVAPVQPAARAPLVAPAHMVPIQQAPRRSPSVQQAARVPSVAPVHHPTPAAMPSSQPLDSKPNLHPVRGITVPPVVLTTIYRLKASIVIGKDGNCMFRAMAYHLTGNQNLHMEVRTRAIDWLQRNPAILMGFAAQGEGHFSAASYLSNMARPGEWGDEIMLMAIAQAYSISIMVYSGIDTATGVHNATVYPHDAPGPHYGLIHIRKTQHYELLYP